MWGYLKGGENVVVDPIVIVMGNARDLAALRGMAAIEVHLCSGLAGGPDVEVQFAKKVHIVGVGSCGRQNWSPDMSIKAWFVGLD